MNQIWALRSRLEKQPTDPAAAGRKATLFMGQDTKRLEVNTDLLIAIEPDAVDAIRLV
jgi:hypothetical protein